MNATQQERVMQGIRAALAAIANGGNAPLPALYQQFLPDEVKEAPADVFFYGVDFVTLVQGTTITRTFTVQRDSDYLMVGATATVELDATPQTAGLRNGLTVTMEDTGAGRQLQNLAVPLLNVAGTGELPCYWPQPKFIRAASDFATTIINGQGGGAADLLVRWTYFGFKLFTYDAG